MDDKDNKLSNLDKPLTTWELMRATQSDDEKKELDVSWDDIKTKKLYIKERAKEILGSDKAALEFMYKKVIRNPKYDKEED